MQTMPPHPLAGAALRILNLGAVWQPTAVPAFAPLCANIPPLRALLVAARLAELYEMIFPGQPAWLDEPVDWKSETAVIAAVELFLNRANALFPIHEEVWDSSLEGAELFLYEIPVMPMGFDIWCDDWCEMQEPAPYLLHMVWSRERTDRAYRSGDEFEALYPDHNVPEFLEPHRLIDELRQILAEEAAGEQLPASPLAALPDFILMLNSATDNVWLDVGEAALGESGGYPQWDLAVIEALADEWRRAEPLLDAIIALMNWGESSQAGQAEKLTAVRALLLEAYQRSKENEPTDDNSTEPSPAPAA